MTQKNQKSSKKSTLWNQNSSINGIKNRVNSTYPLAALNIDNINAQLIGIIGRKNQDALAEMLIEDLLVEITAILTEKERKEKQQTKISEIEKITNYYLEEVNEYYDMQ